ncbi:MAG: rhomboid family intramembrane serine protease [Nanoarchaeota archaeon]
MINKRSILSGMFSLVSYTNWLILINVVLFFIFSVIIAFNSNFFGFVEVQPASILAGKNLWTIVTAMFMHQGMFHLLVNMFTLFFLGNLTEKIIGRKRFLVLYFIAGVVGSLMFVFGAWLGGNFELGSRVFGGLEDYAAGASGALFGLLGILAVLIPRYRVYLVVGPIIVIIAQFVLLPFIPESAQTIFLVIMNVLIFVTIFALFSRNEMFRKVSVPMAMPLWVAPFVAIIPLVIIGLFVQLPIGNSAHLGGLIAGVVYGLILRLKYPNKVQRLQKLFRFAG